MSHSSSSRALWKDYVTPLLISRPLTVAARVWSSDLDIISHSFFLFRRMTGK